MRCKDCCLPALCVALPLPRVMSLSLECTQHWAESHWTLCYASVVLIWIDPSVKCDDCLSWGSSAFHKLTTCRLTRKLLTFPAGLWFVIQFHVYRLIKKLSHLFITVTQSGLSGALECWLMIPPGYWKLLGEWSFSSGQGSKRALANTKCPSLPPPLSLPLHSDIFLLGCVALQLWFTGSFQLGCLPSFIWPQLHTSCWGEGGWVFFIQSFKERHHFYC